MPCSPSENAKVCPVKADVVFASLALHDEQGSEDRVEVFGHRVQIGGGDRGDPLLTRDGFALVRDLEASVRVANGPLMQKVVPQVGYGGELRKGAVIVSVSREAAHLSEPLD